MKLLELEWAEAKLSIEHPQLTPGGPMISYLGQQLTLEEITRSYEGRQGERIDLTPSPLRVLRSVRSFPVFPLQGVQVFCSPDGIRSRPSGRSWCIRAIVRDEDDTVIGHSGFHGPPEDVGHAEIGYNVLEPYRRNGNGDRGGSIIS